MSIVDAHTHLGPCRVFDLDNSEEDVIDSMNSHNVDISLVHLIRELILQKMCITEFMPYPRVMREEFLV